MTEKLLHFIWQFQYFNLTHLETTTGEPIQIIHPGTLNHNQGPDFSSARIKIKDTILVGSIELHIKASDWIKHRHQFDKNYSNVILHVVHENDLHIANELPVLELESKIPNYLLTQYSEMMNAQRFISCASSIQQVKSITFLAWKERLLAERLTRKAQSILSHLQLNNQHWEVTFWWVLARGFGGKINGDAFENIARSIPINLLAKHKNQIHQLEALLLGQAGLLKTDHQDKYAQMLYNEYEFLQGKYNLKRTDMPIYFMRMRPGNFPTIRLAQLAVLIHQSVHLFSQILEAGSVKEIKQLLNITANDYWHYHYRLDEMSSYKPKHFGEDAIDNTIINSIIPTLFAYGLYNNLEKYKVKALKWLEEIKAEENVITKGFSSFSIHSQSAFDSQALIELKNEYCTRKRCLECAIGTSLLKHSN